MKTNQEYKDALDGQTFTVETGRWHTKVIDASTQRGLRLFERMGPEQLNFIWVIYEIGFNDETGIDLKLSLNVWLPYLEGNGLHPLLKHQIEIWLDDPEREKELIVGPPI